MGNSVKIGVFITVLFFCYICQAQNDSITRKTESHYKLKLSSNSSVIYPGISTGIEIPVHYITEPELIRKSEKRAFFKTRFVSANLSWYHHPEFHDNLYFTVEWIMRRTRSGGFTSEFSGGPGYSRTYLAGTIYTVNESGDISVIKNAGYNYALVTIGGGLGYDFSVKRKIPVSVFSKINMLSMFPYNSTIYFRPVLEIGIRYASVCANGIRRKGSVLYPK